MRGAGALALVIASVFSAAGSAVGDSGLLPGKSRHGEAFDRGPRWKAYLMGGTGNIHFPVTTKNPLVQKFIEQGVGQLHGFWYVEAERSFRQAAALDPNCGIAYWGMSMSNRLHESRARQFAREAASHKAGLTEREQMYIDALSNEAGYRAIIAKYPRDLEAKAFEVWRIWHKNESITPPPRELADALRLAREILNVDQMHPIHHAVLHIADVTQSPQDGLDSAAKCGLSAPSIGHMWHMPTHLYYGLGRGAEAAWCMEASIRTEHARMMHDRVLPDQVHLYAHNNEWLVRMLLYLGRVHDARRVASQMIDLPRHPLYNTLELPNQAGEHPNNPHNELTSAESDGSSAYFGRWRLLDTLRQYEYWDDLIAGCRSGRIESTGSHEEQGGFHLNLGVAYYCRGDIAEGDREISALRRLLEEERATAQVSLGAALMSSRSSNPVPLTAQVTNSAEHLTMILRTLEAYRRIAVGFFLSRKMLVVYLAVLLAIEFAIFRVLRRRIVLAAISTIPAIGVAVWLFQAHLALLNLPSESPDVDVAYISRKLLDVGDLDSAEQCAREFAHQNQKQVLPQANLVEVLYQVGQRDEARVEFERLRSLAGQADLDAPPLARLAPIAREFGLPSDWRLLDETQQALVGRPPLASLGPLLWRPWNVPDWKLKDAEGHEHSLSDLRGRPVLLLFFLGRSCQHCQKQLKTFAEKSRQFLDEGLTVIAISSDNQAGIKKALADYQPRSFPFLMLADPELNAFQAYKAYDTFEQIALHGTFLVDREGLCRWYDVSFEPFMDVAFVLAESDRLLSRPVAAIEPGAPVIPD